MSLSIIFLSACWCSRFEARFPALDYAALRISHSALDWTLVWRHLSLVEPPLKGGPYVCWNRLHGNVFG